MKNLFCTILSVNRKRRNMAVSVVLWLLQQLRVVEEHEMYRYEGMLNKLDLEPESATKREYAAIEEECILCEYSLGVIDYIIEDLSMAYGKGV